MNNNIKWRFPGNSYASTTGLDTADLETFKSDANAALAREIAQNSIDARLKENSGPVRIEFKLFKIKKEDIPGQQDLVKNINNCLDYWKEFNSEKTINGLNKILEEINRNEITCLRISDYNTSGLIGVSDDFVSNTPWNSLVHGSGVSEKNESSGGSKGIGKFATFVNSHFRTVFYATKTKNDEVGYEGICKLCSGKMEGTDELTQGIGYFGLSDKNKPILEELVLDKKYSRKDDDYGTDIYILGFKQEERWKEEIICKVLDSFMSAIVFETLEVIVDNIVINKETLKSIVYNEKIVSNKYDKQRILSQYLLLNDPDTYITDIEVERFGNVRFYVRKFENDEADLAMNKCIMVRYPYMKIKDKSIQSLVKISSLCIIPDGVLCRELRKIENPQHIDWEFKRIEDITIRTQIKKTMDSLYKKINDEIAKYTLSKGSKETSIEGTEDIIQADDSNDDKGNEESKKILDDAKPTTPVRNRPVSPLKKEEEGTDDFTEKTDGETGEGTEHPGGDGNGGKGPGKCEKPNGGITVSKIFEVKGVTYNFVCRNKSQGKYTLIFTPDKDIKKAIVIITGQDESNAEIDLGIKNCKVNGIDTFVYDHKMIKLEFKKGCKYKVDFDTNQTELFACWVKTYENKE